MTRKDPDFGLRRTIQDIFDGADLPDDVRDAIAEAEKFNQPAPPKPVQPQPPIQPAPLTPVSQPEPPKDLGPQKRGLKIHPISSAPSQTAPVVSEPAPTEPQAQPPAPEERGLSSDIAHDEIEQLKKHLRCPKGFECTETGYTVLCNARVTLGGKVVECVGKDQKKCRFRRSVFGKGICGCRMRQYIARKLGL